MIATITGCVSSSAFASLVGISITKSQISIKNYQFSKCSKICVKNAGIKKYKPVNKKNGRSMIKQYC